MNIAPRASAELVEALFIVLVAFVAVHDMIRCVASLGRRCENSLALHADFGS